LEIVEVRSEGFVVAILADFIRLNLENLPVLAALHVQTYVSDLERIVDASENFVSPVSDISE
jgi:hypothetical protein